MDDSLSDYNVIFVNFPPKVRACVMENQDGSYTIAINSQLLFEEQYDAVRHELSHINRLDLYKECFADMIEARAHKNMRSKML